jgi:hypothetical protein
MSMSKGGSVPQLRWSSVRRAASDRTRRRHREARNTVCWRGEFGDQNLRECLARLSPGQKAGFEGEIGFGGFEHLTVPSSPSRQ